MSKKNQNEVATEATLSATEKLFEKHGKKIVITLVVLFLLAIGGFTYKYFVLDKNEAAAKELIVTAQSHLSGEAPDYKLALEGDENGAGFLDVIEQYGSTNAGNIANHYAGVCYLHLGDLENAAKYLKEYEEVDGDILAQIINAQNLGLQGDIAVELGKYAEAVELFGKAVKASHNDYTTPYYLYKKALALEAIGKVAEAKTCCENIVKLFPTSLEAREADKLLY